MTDWVTISSLATGAGTLVLAVATFSSVKSANRSARLAERSLMAGVQPVLIPSREEDPLERVRFGEGKTLTVPGHGAAVEFENDVIYLAIALRNGGSGLAVMHGWRARAREPREPSSASAHADALPDLDDFRRQQLDLYIPAGDTGYWQGALRDPEEPGYAEVRDALATDEIIQVDLLYGDYEGGQRTVLRMSVLPWPDMDGMRAYALRYWSVDRDDPR
jgi:hypothetical protein